LAMRPPPRPVNLHRFTTMLGIVCNERGFLSSVSPSKSALGKAGEGTDASGHGVEFVHGGCASSEVELGVVSDVLVRFPEQLVVCSA
jgi:hypothetical protein